MNMNFDIKILGLGYILRLNDESWWHWDIFFIVEYLLFSGDMLC